ncbi:MAG: palindromic element RPE1 domain-containing protein, partial [Rickettsia endosymbiont of Labidopullus appendiculatus]|nr:palindromic element RPE1 domain-containing protein [Rickettsia endosymbiont of Labidopullus appendiculatus]
DNIDTVLKESSPQSMEKIVETGQVDSQGNNGNIESSLLSLAELQAKKLQLITAAEQQYPLYFEQLRKIAELQQHMQDQFSTNSKIEQIPKWFLDILLEEKAKLQQLHQEHINNPEFQEYLATEKQLDQQIINNLQRQQWETKGYDLSPEDSYIARKQLEEGKHINLDNPQEAESFYHGDDEKFDTNNRPLAKLAYAEEFEGDAERRTAAYLSVREDSSTASTYKLPAEVEFCKRSISN